MLKFKILFTIFFIVYSSLAYSNTNEIDSLLNDSSKAFEEKRTEDGLILLDKASYIAETQKDARACLEIGSIYAELPEELERKESAISILKKGAKFAIVQENWSILEKFGVNMERLGENDAAIQIYDEIFLKAGKLRDKDTFVALKVRYENLGDLERAELCRQMIEKLNILPPPGWQPYGETVRGPKTVPAVVQSQQRRIADQQIQAAMEYFIEKRKLEEQKKKRFMP